MWVKVASHRWNKMEQGFVVGCIWRVSDGSLRAWRWPRGDAQKTELGSFLSKSRAMEVIDND